MARRWLTHEGGRPKDVYVYVRAYGGYECASVRYRPKSANNEGIILKTSDQ
jgi:hypothetical protein